MLSLRRLTSRGDTIIEVLIALAILGSALSMGFATASRALTTSRISQEHSEVQGYLDAQAELLRQAAPSFATPASNIYTARTFCMVPNGTDTPVRADFQVSYTRPADPSADTLAAAASPTPSAPYPQSCVVGGRYYVSIVYTQDTNGDGNPDDLFSVYVRWEGLSTLSRQQAVMTYKIHQATAGGGSIGGAGTPLPPPPPITPPAPTCAAVIPTNAFDGCYFSDMAFGTVALDRTDAAINFDWGLGSPGAGVPNDKFSARWRGNYTFSSSGNYNFTIAGDDGVRLFVDGNPVTLTPSGSFTDHPSTTYKGNMNISAGTHLVTMEFYENGGYASASLSWAFIPPPVVNTLPVYRTLIGSNHSFTPSKSEMTANIDSGGSYEGIGFYAVDSLSGPGTEAVHRLNYRWGSQHYFTASASELSAALASGAWTDAGISFYEYPSNVNGDLVPVYTMYRAWDNDHFYTTSYFEYQNAIKFVGYADQGIAFWAPPGSTSVPVGPTNVAKAKPVTNPYCGPGNFYYNVPDSRLTDDDIGTNTAQCNWQFQYQIDLQGYYNLSSVTATWGTFGCIPGQACSNGYYYISWYNVEVYEGGRGWVSVGSGGFPMAAASTFNGSFPNARYIRVTAYSWYNWIAMYELSAQGTPI